MRDYQQISTGSAGFVPLQGEARPDASASDGSTHYWNSAAGPGGIGSTEQSHAAVLRRTGAYYNAGTVRLVRQLQRQYGNSHMQKVVALAGRREAEAERDRSRKDESTTEGLRDWAHPWNDPGQGQTIAGSGRGGIGLDLDGKAAGISLWPERDAPVGVRAASSPRIYIARDDRCPTGINNCRGPCGKGGRCSWFRSRQECDCIGSMDIFPGWLLVLLSAAALALLAACIASGVCEVAAITAAVGAALAAVVIGVLRSSGVVVDGPATVAANDSAGAGNVPGPGPGPAVPEGADGYAASTASSGQSDQKEEA
jgi:hypothetical protein